MRARRAAQVLTRVRIAKHAPPLRCLPVAVTGRLSPMGVETVSGQPTPCGAATPSAVSQAAVTVVCWRLAGLASLRRTHPKNLRSGARHPGAGPGDDGDSAEGPSS